jgi:hypothetical protein
MAITKSWTTFIASTTIRASEVMGMFGWSEGNIVPHSTGTLADNQFSLGTSTAEWGNVYADKITISSGTSSFLGNVGIGTTSPTALLSIKNSAANGYSLVEIINDQNSSSKCLQLAYAGTDTAAANKAWVFNTYNESLSLGTNNTDRLTILGNGNVGIGTTSPSCGLEVYNSEYPCVRFNRTTSDTTNIYAALSLNNKTSANMADGFGSEIEFSIEDSAAVKNPIAYISGYRAGADNSGAMGFYTYSAGSATHGMTILPLGNVGIGTTSPSEKLSVYNNDTLNWTSYFKGVSNTGGSFGVRIQAGTDSSDYTFQSLNYAGSNLFLIRGDGNVGIGTTEPTSTLQVVGTITCNGINCSGSITCSTIKHTNPFCKIIGENKSISDVTSITATLDSEIIDNGFNMFTTTSDSKIYAPLTGVYQILGAVRFSDQGTGGIRRMWINVNTPPGVRQVLSESMYFVDMTTNGLFCFNTSAILTISAGDWVTLNLYQNSGATLSYTAHLNMRYIGA